VSRPGETLREVVTPEGVPLRFQVAGLGERLGAFVLDCGLLLAGALVVVLMSLLAVAAARGLGAALGLAAFFLLRSFYFTWFECRGAGATPGKRLLGLRVIDGHGGILTPEAVFARNFMREIELFVPLAVAVAPEALLPDQPSWARLASALWLVALVLVPLFNRDRLRAGDLVAGTLVVRAPRAVLLEDLSAEAPAAARRAAPAFDFTPSQLDLYGIEELQVLEKLLRQGAARAGALEAVADQIQRKIGWPRGAPRASARDFLQAFYTAQRARLERRMLLGERRQSKRDAPPRRTP
jgi:uncharacterized RDD family membrane protein YckC